MFTLSVTDADLDPNGPPFTYDIIAGRNNDFYVDRQGVIRSASGFDRQSKDEYHLTVRVFDNGTPPLYSDIDIAVFIVERSSSPPVVTPLSTTVTVTGDDVFPGGVIGRVRAFDNDPADRLVFAIVRDEDRRLFDIDAVDGTVRVVQGLDVGDYIVNISVTDGQFTRYADVKLSVEGVSDDATDSAVVVRLDSLTPEEFVNHHMDSFILALQSELHVRNTAIKVSSGYVLLLDKALIRAVETTNRSRFRHLVKGFLCFSNLGPVCLLCFFVFFSVFSLVYFESSVPLQVIESKDLSLK